jgi:hypothetical protein
MNSTKTIRIFISFPGDMAAEILEAGNLYA